MKKVPVNEERNKNDYTPKYYKTLLEEVASSLTFNYRLQESGRNSRNQALKSTSSNYILDQTGFLNDKRVNVRHFFIVPTL